MYRIIKVVLPCRSELNAEHFRECVQFACRNAFLARKFDQFDVAYASAFWMQIEGHFLGSITNSMKNENVWWSWGTTSLCIKKVQALSCFFYITIKWPHNAEEYDRKMRACDHMTIPWFCGYTIHISPQSQANGHISQIPQRTGTFSVVIWRSHMTEIWPRRRMIL